MCAFVWPVPGTLPFSLNESQWKLGKQICSRWGDCTNRRTGYWKMYYDLYTFAQLALCVINLPLSNFSFLLGLSDKKKD